MSQALREPDDLGETSPNAKTCTQSEYGRRVGLPPQRVHKLAQEGRLALNEAGAVLIQESDEMLAAMTQTRQGGTKSNAALVREVAEARLRTERAKAAKLELEVAQAASLLVEAEAVQREASDQAARLRSALELLPDRLAAEVHSLDDVEQVRARLDEELRKVLQDFAGGDYD